jgi:hypothetical protein
MVAETVKVGGLKVIEIGTRTVIGGRRSNWARKFQQRLIV